ncbi:pickpocket protein 28-like [Anopheles ziemanni]|uniref:pickpocket protein 28-like n=1 Tax=Anopheles coustani TaxID=139045 RepID=UPI002659D5B5|nr:pickpocket protein 28-like [Anopheles coustani]XP_058170041.1 pickpocket protein 28-like [Anopheles ziemanni]
MSDADLYAFSAAKKSKNALKVEVFREYCAGSSIHGVRYFDRTERTSCERFWWIIVFLLSMAGCGTMIFKTYIKWNQAPIIVSFSEKTTPVWEIQFPAVTICPETKVQAAKLNVTAEINALYENSDNWNITHNADTVGKLKVVAQVCNTIVQDKNYDPSHLNGTYEKNAVNILRNLSLDRDRVVSSCRFNDVPRSCKRYMKETVTENGLCYSFNMLPEEEIFRKNALHNEHTNIEYLCTGETQGYKLMLHESSEYPQVSKRHIRIPLGHEMSIAMKPQMMTTSKSAADYHWSKRQCFFDNERRLRFFQIYNQENCELECLANITLAVCGCVRFSMPRAPGVDVCSLEMWFCMHQARAFFRESFNHSDASLQHGTNDGGNVATECICLPACSSIQYDLEVTQSAMDMIKYLEANRIFDKEAESIIVSKLEIYFKESHFITSRRSELYGMVDFLANCGGLLGLFMGVSILSLLEICYYITIHPFSLKKKRKQGYGSEDRNRNNKLPSVTAKLD